MESDGQQRSLETQVELLEAELVVLRTCLVRLSMVLDECRHEQVGAMAISIELQAFSLL